MLSDAEFKLVDTCTIGTSDVCLLKVNGKVEVACKKSTEKEMALES